MKEVPLVAAVALALLTGAAAPRVVDGFSEHVGAEQQLLGAREADLPVTREIATGGVVVGLVDLAFVRARLSTGQVAELRQAFAVALDLDRDVLPGDAFEVRYAETRSLRGAVIDRRLLWAEFRTTTRGSLAVHRFRGRDHVERLWLADGRAARPPAMRMPLDAVVVSSGFGVRPDPFEQPGAGSSSRTASLKRGDKPPAAGGGSAITATTPLAVLLGLEPTGGRTAKQVAGAILCPSCLHEGIDLVAPAGTPIHAAADGVVSGAAPNGRYGNWVRIEHAGRLATVYGHLERFAPGLQPGRTVARGEVIGFVGSTGHSTGAHLHFELRADDRAVDPLRSPLFKGERLHGPELERFRRQVARSLERRTEAAALP